MNHTLFFLNLGGIAEQEENESGYLFANDFVIFDEAHTVEQVAARQIGLGVSQYGLRYALRRLYNPETKKGLFQLHRNVGWREGDRDGAGRGGDVLRQAGRRARTSRRAASSACGSRISWTDSLTAPLARLQQLVVQTLKGVEDEMAKAELQDMGRRIRDARAGIATFLKQDAEDHVYWVEKTGKTQQWHSLNAAPIDVAAHLRALLFPRGSLLRDDQRDAQRRAARRCSYFRRSRRRRGGGGAADRQPVRLPAADAALHHQQDARPARRRLRGGAGGADRALRRA